MQTDGYLADELTKTTRNTPWDAWYL